MKKEINQMSFFDRRKREKAIAGEIAAVLLEVLRPVMDPSAFAGLNWARHQELMVETATNVCKRHGLDEAAAARVVGSYLPKACAEMVAR
jgi:hypothetical protein